MTDRARLRRRMVWLSLGLVVALLLVSATLLVVYARGGGPLPGWLGFLGPRQQSVLAPSTPAETVLRTLRLAGFDSAAVGESGGDVVVRVAVPQVRDASTIEMSWQTALTAGAVAYPRAGKVTAQLFSGTTPLLEVSADADTVRQAAERDDAATLRRSLRFRYLSSAGGSQ